VDPVSLHLRKLSGTYSVHREIRITQKVLTGELGENLRDVGANLRMS
jgi:hypothetical protein